MEYVLLAAGHLKANRIPSARLDAELLLAHVLGVDRLKLYVQFDRPLTEEEVSHYRVAIARRAKGEPVAYIMGEKEFYSLQMYVDSRVLIPRPETEMLVDETLSGLKERFPVQKPWLVADIGTGSGAISVALLKNSDQIEIVATDLHQDALDVAKHNATRHDVLQRITCRRGDLFQPLSGQRFHAIVSNPPYISTNDYETLDRDVKNFEPRQALISGTDGLDHIRRLVHGAASYLLPGGFMAIEIGAEQGDQVMEMATAAGYMAYVQKDVQGLDRIVCMWK